ncbi:hypothetical protein NL676_003059 [Syzygium grande]|nr:hypothetical protein NL676_003059 [Syzygium grande]
MPISLNPKRPSQNREGFSIMNLAYSPSSRVGFPSLTPRGPSPAELTKDPSHDIRRNVNTKEMLWSACINDPYLSLTTTRPCLVRQDKTIRPRAHVPLSICAVGWGGVAWGGGGTGTIPPFSSSPPVAWLKTAICQKWYASTRGPNEPQGNKERGGSKTGKKAKRERGAGGGKSKGRWVIIVIHCSAGRLVAVKGPGRASAGRAPPGRSMAPRGADPLALPAQGRREGGRDGGKQLRRASEASKTSTLNINSNENNKLQKRRA